LAEAEAHRTELAVAAERHRIAREMHDIVAHSLSVIVIQADGGRYAATQDPAAAERALTTIAETGRAALADTRRILGLLRAETDGGERSPVPTTGTLADLVATVRSGGLDVTYVQTGSPRPLPPGVRLATYRICQESLTNVLRHGGAGAQTIVTQAWRETGLRLTVRNTPGARPLGGRSGDGAEGAVPSGDGCRGHGLIGMRERAEFFGGTVTAGPADDGGFRVQLDLPYPDPTLWHDATTGPADTEAAAAPAARTDADCPTASAAPTSAAAPATGTGPSPETGDV
jgi:signal transduction histidine kinase